MNAFFNFIASSILQLPPQASEVATLALTTADFEFTTWNQPETGFNNRSALAVTKFSTTGTDIIVGLYTDITGYEGERKISIFDSNMNWVSEILPGDITTEQTFNVTLPSSGTYYITEGGNVLESGMNFYSTSVVSLEGEGMTSETITLNNDCVVNIGDSISIGDGCITNSKDAYMVKLRQSMTTYDFITDGFGGQFADNHFSGDIRNTDCANRLKVEFDKRTGRQVVLFTLGTNDYGARNVTPAEYKSAVQAGFNKILEINPTAEIIAISPLERGNETTANNGGAYVLDEFRTALQEVCTATTGATYYEGRTMLAIADGDFTSDELHPNEQGHAKLATEIETILNT